MVLTINKTLRKARKDAGLTQKQVADKASVAERLYQDYEYNKREPKVHAAIRIATVLHSNVEYLFDDEILKKVTENDCNPDK